MITRTALPAFFFIMVSTIAIADSTGYLGMSLPADFTPFTDDSPWNTPIPDTAQVDPGSPLMMGTVIDVLDSIGAPRYLRVNYRVWTSPIHVIDAATCPRIDIPTTGDGLYWTTDPDGDGIAQNIPMPESGPWPDPQADHHMIMVDTTLMLAWEFSYAEPLGGGQWEASRVDIYDLHGPGWRPAFVDPNWWRIGCVGAGVNRLAGTVRIEEVLAGEIDHPLLCCTPANRSKSLPGGNPKELCPPASMTDGWRVGPENVPEGAVFRLDPSLDLDALGFCEPAKVVARAMQEYGMYNVDNGGAFAVYFQNLGSANSPWEAIPNLISDLQSLPVTAFRVLRCDTVTKDVGSATEYTVEFVTHPPKSVAVGRPLPPITLRVVDEWGNPVATDRSFDVMVSIGMWEGTNPGGAELLGTYFKPTEGGYVTFNNLVITKPGKGYRLFALPRDLHYAVSDVFAAVKRAPVPLGEDHDQEDGLELVVFPCPGRSAFRVSYRLPGGGPVSLKVYDVAGREVVGLLDEKATAGWHTINWNPEGLAAGTYFMTLEAGGTSHTARTVIVE